MSRDLSDETATPSGTRSGEISAVGALEERMSRLDRRTFLKTASASAALVAPAAAAAQSPKAAPGRPPKSNDTGPREKATNAGGLSKARLARMHDVMTGHVERGELPGLVTLVSRRGEVHVDAIGMKAAGGRDPMRRDTIFRIASMTKPIAAAAAMILVEECRLRLDEPVDRLLPELVGRKVLKRLDGPLDDTVPANRPISVRDLLTLRMSLGYIMEPSSAYPIQKAMNEQQILQGPPKPQTPPAPDERIRRVATLPLMHQPGEKWMYDLGVDVLGVLIARASGQPLETFRRQRIFEPLGMKDTGFSVPATRLDRLATSYWTHPETRELELYDEAVGGQWSRPPAFPSGGVAEGLNSTIMTIKRRAGGYRNKEHFKTAIYFFCGGLDLYQR